MKKLFAIAFLSVVIFPSAVFAADTLLSPYWGPVVSCVGGAPITGADGKTIPTCTSLCDVFATAQNALRLGVTIAIFILVPIYFMYGGYRVATSGISGDKISEIRKMLGHVVIGVLIIVCSFAIVNTVMNGISGIFGAAGEGSSWLKIACTRQTNPEESFGPSGAPAGGVVTPATCDPACKSTEECKQSGNGVWGCVIKEATSTPPKVCPAGQKLCALSQQCIATAETCPLP